MPLDYRALRDALDQPPPRRVQPWDDRHPDWHRAIVAPPPEAVRHGEDGARFQWLGQQDVLARAVPQRLFAVVVAVEMMWDEFLVAVEETMGEAARDSFQRLLPLWRALDVDGAILELAFHVGRTIPDSPPGRLAVHWETGVLRPVRQMMRFFHDLSGSLDGPNGAANAATLIDEALSFVPGDSATNLDRWWARVHARLAARDATTAELALEADPEAGLD